MRIARDLGRRLAPVGAVIFAVATLGLGACSSGGGGHPAPTDAASEAPVTADAPFEATPTVYTCQDIRTCAVGCADRACLDACAARGSTEAQSVFGDLSTCLATLDTRPMPTASCTGVDPGCYCPEECFVDGYCLDQVAACLASSPGVVNDTVCNGTCMP